jgi:putative two-component system response regulator
MSIQPDTMLARVLVVDDQKVNVVLLERMLRGAGYTAVTTTTDPTTVRDLHIANRYDLIMLDLQMPGMDGFSVMEELKSIEGEDYLPVLAITAQPGYKLQALDAGAKDFISKPFEQAEVLARVRNLLEVRLLHGQLRNYNESLELRVAQRTTELQESYLETISALTRAAEHKDEETGCHVRRISCFCRELAERLGMDAGFTDEIYFASPMHDVGKIGIPDAILFKPGKLTAHEWSIMKEHSAMGYRILGDSPYRYLGMGAEIALGHHERWNGGGYPAGSAGEVIPVSARIMSICDTYDALRSARPYKPALSHSLAMQIITRGDGRTEPEHFDPSVLSAFVGARQCFSEIFETWVSQTAFSSAGGR